MMWTRILVGLIWAVISALANTEGSISSTELQAIVDQMRTKDCGAAKVGGVTLDYQDQTSTRHDYDHDDKPFFEEVDEGVFQSATYQTYFRLFNIFHPDVNTPEKFNSEQSQLIDDFLNAVIVTPVFKVAQAALLKHGLIPTSPSDWLLSLRKIWFGLYSRATDGSGALGSSGFEHVFLGEYKGTKTEGQHHWARYYKLEKAGSWNYYGWMQRCGSLIATIQYEWGPTNKPIGGSMIGTSVEFDFSLYTLCYLAQRGGKACQFSINNYDLAITSYEENNTGFIGTTYPVIMDS